MDIINKNETNGKITCWQRYKGTGTLVLVGIENALATVGNSLAVPQKLNIKLQYDPATPIMRICSKELKTDSFL